MLIRRSIDRIRHQDWTALVSELIIVVVGIFIAIQVDSWWQHRNDLERKAAYIERLTRDVKDDKIAIAYAVRLATLRKELAELLIATADNPDVARREPSKFLMAVRQAAYTYTPALDSHTFDELTSTGNLRLLRDETLKTALFDYYRYDESQRQYMSLQLMQEFRHFELGADILTNELSIWIQDNMRIVGPDTEHDWDISEIDIEDVVAAAERLAARPDLIAWLPEARDMQLDFISSHGRRLERADALMLALEQSE